MNEGLPTPSKARRRLRFVLVALLTVVSALGLALAFLDTSLGHELLRSLSVRALNGSVLAGRISIARIEGSIYGDLSIFGIRLEDLRGRTALSVERVRIVYDLGGLRHSALRVEQLEIDEPSVLIVEEEDGSSNLAGLTRPTAPEPNPPVSSETPSFSVSLGRGLVKGGQLRFEPKSGARRELRGLSINLYGSYAPEAAELALERLALELVEPPLPIELAASARLAEGSVRASIDLRAGEASLRSEATEIVLDRGAASGRLSLRVPNRSWSRLGLDPALVGDVDLEIQLSEGPPDAPWKIDLDGQVARAPLELRGQLGPAGGRLDLQLRALDPRNVHLAATRGAIDLAAKLDFPEWNRGAAELTLRGEVELLGQRFRVGTMTATAALDGRQAEIDLDLRVVPRGRPADRGEFAFGGRATLRLDETPVIETSTLALRARDLRSLAGELLPLEGLVDLAANARGPMNALEFDARASVRRLRGPGAALQSAEIDVHAVGVPSAAEGDVDLQFESLDLAPFIFSRGRAQVSMRDRGQRAGVELSAEGLEFLRRVALTASIAAGATSTRVNLDSLVVETSSATWEASPALVTAERGGAIELSPLVVSSRSGTLRARARVDPARWTEGTAEVALEDLSLAALAGLSPSLRSLSGQVGLALKMTPGRASPSVSLQVAVEELRRFGQGPVEASLDLSLAERKAQLSTRLEGADVGSFSVRVAGTTPPNLEDVERWKDPRLLGALEARFDTLSLGRLIALTSTKVVVDGRIDGAIAVGPGGETARGRLELRALSASGRQIPADTTLAIDAGRDQIELSLTSTLAGSKPIRVELSSNVGSHTWLERGVEAGLQAGAELHLLLENLPAPVLAALAELPADDPRFDEPRGVVSLALDGRGGPDALELKSTVSLFRVALAKRAPELDLEVVTTLEGGRAHLEATGSLAKSGRLELALEADVPSPADLGALAAIDQRAIRSIRGRIDSLRLAALAELGLSPEPMTGTAALHVDLGPALTRGALDLRIHRVKPGPRLAELDLGARLDFAPERQALTATVSASRSTLCVLGAEIEASLDALRGGRMSKAPITARLIIPEAPIASFFAPKMAPMQGTLRLRGQLDGSIEAPSAELELEVMDGKAGQQSFDTLEADLAYGRDQAAFGLSAKQATGGSLELAATLLAVKREPRVEARLEAAKFDLGFVGELLRTAGGGAVGVDGVLGGELLVTGLAAAPSLDGSLSVEALDVVLPGEVPPLANGSLQLALAPDRYQLELRGQLGQGEITFETEAKLRGLEHVDLAGEFVSRGVRVTAGSQIVALDTKVELSGERRGKDTKIGVVIGETLVDLPKGRGKRLRPITELADVRLVDSFDVAEDVARKARAKTATGPAGTLSVAVKAPKPIVARGGENYLEISPDIELELGPTKRSMVGEIGVDGRLNILRRRYDFRRGRITFPGSFPPDPRLDLQLGHDFDTMTLLVNVGGTAKRPEVRFGAEPSGYDQATLLGIFLGAEPSEVGGKSAGRDTARAAASALASQLASKVGEDLPFDTIELDVGGGNRSMSITAGKWLTDDIFVAYQYKFTPPSKTNENQGEGIVRWHFTRGWSLETRFGDRAAGSIDAIWLKRF